MSRARVIARNAGFLTAGQFVTWTFTIVFMVIVPRRVGPSEWGEYSLAGAVTALAGTVASLGLNTLLIKEVSRDLSRASKYIGAAITAQLLLAIPYVLIVGVTALTISHSPHTRIIIALSAIAGVLGFVLTPLMAGLQAFEKMYFNTAADVITKGLMSLAAVLLTLFFAAGIIGIQLVTVVAVMLVAVLDILWMSRSVPVRLNFDWHLVRHLIIGGLPYWASGLFLTIYLWVDAVMLAAMTNTTVVGWYGAPTRIFNTLLFVPTILTTALFPALANTSKHDPAQMKRLARRSFGLLISLGLPIATGAALLAMPVVRLLFGPYYGPSGPILLVLALTLVPTYINILGGTLLIAADRQTQWTRVMAVMCVINPAINIFAISYFQRTYGNGGLGAALALLITEILMAIVALVMLPRDLLNGGVLSSIARSAVATALMAAVVRLFQSGYIGGWVYVGKVTFTLYTLVIPVALGATTYAIAALVLRVFPREDLIMVTSLAAGVGRKLGLRLPSRSTEGARGKQDAMGVLALFTEDLQAWKRMGWTTYATRGERIRGGDVIPLLWRHFGVRATLVYRLSSAAHRRHIPGLPTALHHFSIRHYGLDIVPSVPIGPGLYIPHPFGTVVMARSIGRNCKLIGGISIGMRRLHDYPIIGDDVFIGTGARVLGGICVGDGAQIGANAVVLSDVPAGATAVGVPAHILQPRHDQRPEVVPADDEHFPVLAGAYSVAYRAGNGHHLLDEGPDDGAAN